MCPCGYIVLAAVSVLWLGDEPCRRRKALGIALICAGVVLVSEESDLMKPFCLCSAVLNRCRERCVDAVHDVFRSGHTGQRPQGPSVRGGGWSPHHGRSPPRAGDDTATEGLEMELEVAGIAEGDDEGG